MFEKILIANRGEIACRIVQTARRLGIVTVAVYSDADANAKHVAMADEAVRIGPALVNQSYLVVENIIRAARQTGAQAIHPGYGFLSENPEFVEALEAAKIQFIGPPASAIRAMGLKDAAKALMEKAGVPVVPGYHGERQDAEFLKQEAASIGYPVLIKARAGGGGKGMRRVDDPAEFEQALASAKREAQASFGDSACLIEKYISSPRHVEIQLFADKHGNVVHLFERDCSLQRRHQKVIEEAPAPGMPEDVRNAMGRAACEAARAIGYQGAGTVEFIADGSHGLHADGFWFMEMNTRLQVEHPVSEAITGLDLVELQLRAAAGEPLGFCQNDLTINGHAFEARIYAEDVPKGFLPATGRLEHVSLPEAVQFERAPVRIDSAVGQGDEITPFYDPMIAKLIVHGPDRQAALQRLKAALTQVQIAGSTTNVSFLLALASHSGFGRGEVDTGLIERDLKCFLQPVDPPEPVLALAMIKSLDLTNAYEEAEPFAALIGWRAWGRAEHQVRLLIEEREFVRTIAVLGRGHFQLMGEPNLTLQIDPCPDGGLILTMNGCKKQARVVQTQSGLSVFWEGHFYQFTQPDPLSAVDDTAIASDQIAAPMPGLVKLVSVAAGQEVLAGEGLLVLEAMKMEHTLKAPRNGRIAQIFVKTGDQVSDGAILLKFEPVHD